MNVFLCTKYKLCVVVYTERFEGTCLAPCARKGTCRQRKWGTQKRKSPHARCMRALHHASRVQPGMRRGRAAQEPAKCLYLDHALARNGSGGSASLTVLQLAQHQEHIALGTQDVLLQECTGGICIAPQRSVHELTVLAGFVLKGLAKAR